MLKKRKEALNFLCNFDNECRKTSSEFINLMEVNSLNIRNVYGNYKAYISYIYLRNSDILLQNSDLQSFFYLSSISCVNYAPLKVVVAKCCSFYNSKVTFFPFLSMFKIKTSILWNKIFRNRTRTTNRIEY